MKKRTAKILAALLGLVLALSACGGRGEGIPAESTVPAETLTTETPEAETQTVEAPNAETPAGTETPQTEPGKAIMIEGTLYYASHDSEVEGRCGVMDGTITSTVEEGRLPTESNQSNFGEGYGYQYGLENTIEVYFPEEDRWVVFESDPDAPDGWGIKLEAKEAAPTGLTLVCTQSGGNISGTLETGSPFWIEEKTEDGWTALAFPENLAFTREAWIIPLEDSAEWPVDWSGALGELPPGTYRIAKNIMDFRETGDWDQKTYYAEFTLE